ncbi:hypothetical protein, partial [Anaerorhabdus sp.]|uniref:hypothetical protein n=1 Tax=Anaerorhabdus sp. TaxID=1872524 RepID=UPI002B2073C9
MLGKVLAKSDGFFPAGYKFKSVALGNKFPGFNNNVIPIAMDLNGSGGTQHTGGGGTSWNGSSKINNETALTFGYSIGGLAQYNNIIMTSRATAYSVFLPYFFAFDYEKIKNTIKSGNVTCWLEKIGGGG